MFYFPTCMNSWSSAILICFPSMTAYFALVSPSPPIVSFTLSHRGWGGLSEVAKRVQRETRFLEIFRACRIKEKSSLSVFCNFLGIELNFFNLFSGQFLSRHLEQQSEIVSVVKFPFPGTFVPTYRGGKVSYFFSIKREEIVASHLRW